MNKRLMIISIEFKLLLRNYMNMFFALFFPVMMLLLFGEMYGNEPSEFFNGRGGMDVMVPSYICMIVAVTGIMSLPLTVAQYRERKILKRFKATPIKQSDILLAQIISNLLLTLVGIGLLLTIGKIRFNLHFYGNPILAIIVLLFIILSVFAIGLLVSGVASNGKSATAISYIIYFPMLFLSGATMPIEMFPASLKKISNVLPLTHAVKLFKGIWFGESLFDFTKEIVILLIVIIVCMTLAIKMFKWE